MLNLDIDRSQLTFEAAGCRIAGWGLAIEVNGQRLESADAAIETMGDPLCWRLTFANVGLQWDLTAEEEPGQGTVVLSSSLTNRADVHHFALGPGTSEAHRLPDELREGGQRDLFDRRQGIPTLCTTRRKPASQDESCMRHPSRSLPTRDLLYPGGPALPASPSGRVGHACLRRLLFPAGGAGETGSRTRTQRIVPSAVTIIVLSVTSIVTYQIHKISEEGTFCH